MLADIEIAQKAKLKPIQEVAQEAGLLEEEIEPYGKYKAKVSLSALKRLEGKPNGHLILVTTMTPTPKGEGKTTTTIGLAQALSKIGKKSFIAIRQPSLGPVMGMKGGAAGGGYSQVLPMEDINLHFTSDIHVITSAHNLLSALLDNHIYHGNELEIDPKRISWPRAVDMNDRALRRVAVEYGERIKRIYREEKFAITASSEVMAILCLSLSLTNLKERLGNIIVGFSYKGKPIRAQDLKAAGAMALLMKDALKPNLVQGLEGAPAFVHGGPFANIAHGCNSLLATKLALKLSDYVVTEAGFGTDLGAEKFFNIKCQEGNLKPDLAVIVVSTRALKLHGMENLQKHIENISFFGVPVVVAINKTETDTESELNLILGECEKKNVKAVISQVWEKGGEGGVALAKEVVFLIGQGSSRFKPLYDLKSSIKSKIEIIATRIYGADGVNYTPEAERDIVELEGIGLSELPVCIAKTQFSLSDDPKKLGRPRGFKITVREVRASAGAGFLVVYTGEIITMPGLPQRPAAENMDITEEGKITGLF